MITLAIITGLAALGLSYLRMHGPALGLVAVMAVALLVRYAP